MAKVIVSLIGDQTIPNIIFIKSRSYDKLVFVTTEYSERQGITENMLKALGVHENAKHIIKISVLENHLLDIEKKLQSLYNNQFLSEGDEILVNVTGGTKPMHTAAYNYFKDKKNTEIVYVPIRKNSYLTFHPEFSDNEKTIEYYVNVKEYLISYGISLESNLENISKNNQTALNNKSCAEKLFHQYLSENGRNTLDCLSQSLRKERDRKTEKLEISQLPPDLIKDIPSELQEKKDWNKEDIRFLTGDWFEHYVFNILLELLPNSKGEIMTGIQIKKGNASNELDVVFTYNNGIYLIECKTGNLMDDNPGDNETDYKARDFTNDVLYKGAALRKQFGLGVEYYLVTTAHNIFKQNKIKENVKNRCESLQVKLVTLHELPELKSYFQKNIFDK